MNNLRLFIVGIAIAAIFCSVSVLAIMPAIHVQEMGRRAKGGIPPSDDTIMVRGKYFRRSSSGGYNVRTEDIPHPQGLESDGVAKPLPAATPTSYFVQQRYDHDNLNDTRVWDYKQRYWINWNYYKTGGPIFFQFGGESNVAGLIDQGQWHYYAYKYGAVLVVLEHRFYGESFPSYDTSSKTLRLLTSHQALEDANYFLDWFRSYYSLQNAQLVAFGGSYPGNLAAWFRQKYPRKANLAVASSAPVQAQFDFPEYFKTISSVIYEMQPSHSCYMAIQSSFFCMDYIVDGYSCSQKYTDKSQLPGAVNTCYNYQLQYPDEVNGFFQILANQWSSNYPGTESALKCNRLEAQVRATPDKIDEYGNFRLQTGGVEVCFRSGKRSLENITESDEGEEVPDEVLRFARSSEGEARDLRSWMWQTCNEFGYFQSGDLDYKLFGYKRWDTRVDVARCQNLFKDANFTSEKIQDNVRKTNDYYLGRNNDGTCIIFVNGKWDPWHPLGINNASQTNSRNTAISIPKSQHCEDMIHDETNPDRLAAQNQIENMIGVYLKDSSCS